MLFIHISCLKQGQLFAIAFDISLVISTHANNSFPKTISTQIRLFSRRQLTSFILMILINSLVVKQPILFMIFVQHGLYHPNALEIYSCNDRNIQSKKQVENGTKIAKWLQKNYQRKVRNGPTRQCKYVKSKVTLCSVKKVTIL